MKGLAKLGIPLLLVSLAASQSTVGSVEIRQVQVVRDGEAVRIEVTLSAATTPAVETAVNPDRLVVVLPNTVSEAKQKRISVGSNGIKGIRYGLNSATPPVSRLVVDLDSARQYTMSSEGNRIILRVQPGTAVASSPRRDGPAPAASAPLVGVFHRQAPSQPPSANVTPVPPVPPPASLPPINLPPGQASSQTSSQTASTAKSAPSATHPKLGSLQEGTVFPGMGAPGAGVVPTTTAQNAAATSKAKTTPASAGQPSPASTPAPLTVVAGTTQNAPAAVVAKQAPFTVEVKSSAPARPQGTQIASTNLPAMQPATPTPASSPTAPVPQGMTSQGPATQSAAMQAQGVHASAAEPTPVAAAVSVPSKPAVSQAPAVTQAADPNSSPGADAASGSKAQNSSTASSPSTQSPNPSVVAATAPVAAATSAEAKPAPSASISNAPAALPNPPAARTVPPATASSPSAAPTSTQNQTAAVATVPAPVPSAATQPANPGPNAAPATSTANVPAATVPVGPAAEEQPEEVAAAIPPPAIPGLALRATHPDFRTAFRVKYVAEGVAYLDGGRSAGLAEGMKLSVRETPNGTEAVPADGSDPGAVAELEVTSVAENSAIADVHDPKRVLKAGDLAYLSGDDEQALVQKSALSATRKYPTVISFTQGDTLDDEVRAEIPRAPMPSINRARGRIGVDYMGTVTHGSAPGTNSNVGLVARLDLTRIGGTYWTLSGYWRGRLTSSSYTGTQTIQDLINRTYHLSLSYDNPNSRWVAGVGRMYLPWATSLDTLDGGYFGARLGHGSTLGVFAGSTPDPTSYSYNPDRRIAGTFINFEGGSFDSFRYTTTSGAGMSSIKWNLERPFIFFENGIFYKRYLSIYDALQLDSPQGNAFQAPTGAGVGRNFTTVRFMPFSRLEFDANYNYMRDLPTFDTSLVGTGLLDRYLFQGFNGGVRIEVLKQIWVYTSLGKGNRSGDASSSLNKLFGITFGRIPWVGVRADAHYSKFDSSFGSGYYDTFSLSRSLNDRLRIEVLGGQQNFTSSFTSDGHSRFVTANVETNLGRHYFVQGGFTLSRGGVQDYDQWLFSLGYRFDSKRVGSQ